LKSDIFQKKLKESVGGTAMPAISFGMIKSIKIPFPQSVESQEYIANNLDSLNEKVNTLQQNYSRICDECDALKQAILRQVFE
jgi:type I restriction enzyme S subunit